MGEIANDIVTRNVITVKRIFHRILIAMENSLLKWVQVIISFDKL